MRKSVGALAVSLLFLLLTNANVRAENWAEAMFETTEHDFGTVARGAKAEFRFKLRNIYMEDVHIASVRSSCGCTQVSIEKPWLKTYEEGAILARFNTEAFLGRKGATVTVVFDKPYYAEVRLHTRGYIRSDVVFQPGSVQFGTLEPGMEAEKNVTVSYAGRSDWQILDVRSSNPHIKAELEELERSAGRVRYNLKVRTEGALPPGYLREHLILVTNDTANSQVPLLVEAMVPAPVSVSPSAIFMGVLQPGQKVTKTLVVRGRQPFRIIGIYCDGGQIQYDESKLKEAKMVHVVPITFIAGEKPGRLVETIRIETDIHTSKPQLSAYAVVAAAGASGGS